MTISVNSKRIPYVSVFKVTTTNMIHFFLHFAFDSFQSSKEQESLAKMEGSVSELNKLLEANLAKQEKVKSESNRIGQEMEDAFAS